MIHIHPEGAFEGIVRQASYLGNIVDYNIEVHGKLLSVAETDPRSITSIYPEATVVRFDLLDDCIHILPA
jgi:hypothetical protein